MGVSVMQNSLRYQHGSIFSLFGYLHLRYSQLLVMQMGKNVCIPSEFQTFYNMEMVAVLHVPDGKPCSEYC